MFEYDSKPKSIWLGATCAVLTLGMAGAVWYTLPILKKHDSLLAQSAGVKQSVNALGGRLEQQNQKLAESSKGLEQLRQEIADVRREMRWRMATVKKQAGKSADELFGRVQKEVRGEIDGIWTKVARLELSRDADEVQIAGLQDELIQLREELALETQDLSDQIAESGSATERRLTGLDASQERDRKALEAVNRKLAIRRIDFEVTKGRNVELAPGISVEITGTDVAYRRVSGWMWVLPDRRTIWLRKRGAQEPVVFYSNDDGKKRELVITSVTKRSAAGYLLLPDEASETAFAPVAYDGPDAHASE